MTDRLVAKGDRTTTKGRVLGGSSSFYAENGQTLARRNDLATCGNCEGAFRIYGTADTILDDGLPLVRHMDRVLCPCKKNLVLSAHDEFLIREGGSSAAVPLNVHSAASGSSQFDEQVRAVGVTDGYPYLIEMADGRSVSGRIESGGALSRMMTGENPGDYTVFWGDDALATSESN